MTNAKVVRNSRYHNQVEADIREALAEFGVPGHLVELERGKNQGHRAVFMLLIDGAEVLREYSMIDTIRATVVDGLELAKACIVLAKSGDLAEQPAEAEEFEDEPVQDNLPQEPVKAAPEPPQVTERAARPRLVAESVPLRKAAARDGTKPIRKRFVGNIQKTRQGYRRPAFISRMID